MSNFKKQTRSSLIVLAAFFVAILLSTCIKVNNYNDKCRNTSTEEITITGEITGVIIEGPWDVTITQDSSYNNVVIEYCDNKNHKVSAKLLPNGYLHVKLSYSGNVDHNHVFRATIQASSLEKIDASGAAGIRTYGHFGSLENISLSGASTVNGLSSDGYSAKIKLSGASTLKAFSFVGNSIDADISGASQANFDNVNLANCEVDCSGASTFKSSGYAGEISFKGAGASNLSTRNLESENLYIDLSGASEADVTVNKTIKGRISGASTLKYKKATNVSGVSVTGASRIVKL